MKLYHKATALFLSLVFVYSCFSCAETPDKDIVVNKGDGTLEDKIENSTGSGLDIDMDNREYTEIDDKYIFHETNNFTSANGIVNFNINADVSIPKGTKMPVLKVSPNYWTPETMEEFARLFIGDATVYEYTDAVSKNEIEKIILEKQQKLNDRDAMLEYYGGDEELVKLRVAQLEKELAAAKTAYETASDTVEKVVSDFKFHNDTYWYTDYGIGGMENAESMKAVAISDGIPYFFNSYFQETNTFRWISYYLWVCSELEPSYDEYRYDYYQTHEFTQEEIDSSITLVEEKLSEIGEIDGMTKWKINGYEQLNIVRDNTTYYYLYFTLTPVYAGYEGMTFRVMENTLWLSSDSEYVGSFNQEAMSIEVSNGKIMLLAYEAPLKIDETLNDNVELTSYDDAVERIYSQLELSITGKNVPIEPYTDYKVISANVDINRIEFSLVRTPIKNSFDEYYILPAWCVYGIYDMTEISNGKKTIKGFTIDPQGSPLFIISAVDGSVISSFI